MGHYRVRQDRRETSGLSLWVGRAAKTLEGLTEKHFPSPLEEEESFLMSVSTASVNISTALSEGHRNGWS